MFYTAALEVYVGQQPAGPYALSTSNIDLVQRLCKPIFGTNRNVTMNNFFTSKELADTLLNQHQLTVFGTVRKNKKFFLYISLNQKTSKNKYVWFSR